MVLTLHLYVLYRSHNNKRLLSYTILVEEWFCVTEVESVYCVVRVESLNTTDLLSIERVSYGRNWGWSSASRFSCYPPGERATRFHWIGDFVGPLASPDPKEKRKTFASALNQTTVRGLFYPKPNLCTHKLIPAPVSYSLAVSYVLQDKCFADSSILALIMLLLACI